MAKLIPGTDLKGNTLTFTIPSVTAIASERIIATAVDPSSGEKLYLKEKPASGNGGTVRYEYENGVLYLQTATFTFPTDGGTFTLTDLEGVIESVDEDAVLYDTISRNANGHYYLMGEDGARRESVSELGRAAGNKTTTFRLPANGDYLIITGSPSVVGYSSLWFVRSEAGTARTGHRIGGDGSNVTEVNAQAYGLGLAVTVNGSSSVRVYALRLA